MRPILLLSLALGCCAAEQPSGDGRMQAFNVTTYRSDQPVTEIVNCLYRVLKGQGMDYNSGNRGTHFYKEDRATGQILMRWSFSDAEDGSTVIEFQLRKTIGEAPEQRIAEGCF